ncbi:predicted protein [Histoplasma mississippiense (nom. inval.)]|nr:predicted protein [Histoplasma mississippiense (nom. inval.)]EDN03304.1 predicted protein [Histoplasma mississippiense (nom. inval.)]
MAVTAQPNLAHYPQSGNLCQQNTASSPSPRTAHNDSPKLATGNPNLVIDTETGSAESLAISSSGIGSEPNSDAALNVNSIMHLQGQFECVNPTLESPYTAEDFDQELRTAMNEFPIAPDDNGYFTLFNPELRNPVYIYNPYRVQSDFDPYDIGQYIDM